MYQIHHTLKVFMSLIHQIVVRNKIIIDHKLHLKASIKPPKDEDLYHFMSMFHMNIINAAAFMDEYNEIFGPKTEKKYHKKIIGIKTCLKPVTSELNIWSDLKKMRNEFSAHNLRSDQKGGIFFFAVNKLSYKAPSNLNDMLLLSDLLQIVLQIIQKEFETENNQLTTAISWAVGERGVPAATKQSAQITLARVVAEMNSLFLKEGKDYQYTALPSTDWQRL